MQAREPHQLDLPRVGQFNFLLVVSACDKSGLRMCLVTADGGIQG